MKKLGHIAYNKLPGKKPAVVFLSGFKSDMGGTKATFLESVCKELGHEYVRFDYFGHGQSDGKFENGTISQWKSDVLKVIDELTSGEIILIGSSMGGWLALLAALERKPRIKAIIGIAAAPDFTEDLINSELSEKQKHEIATTGQTLIQNCYDGAEPYPITKQLIDDGRKNLILSQLAHPALNAGSPHGTPEQVRGVLPITCPVRLIQGMKDADVPYQTASRIMEKLESDDVEIHLIKNGDHRLSTPENLQLLKTTLINIMVE